MRDLRLPSRFWGITQRIVVIPYRRFRTTCPSHLQVSINPCQLHLVLWVSQRFQQLCHDMLACGIYWSPSDFESHFSDISHFLALEDGTDRLLRNLRKELSRYATWKPLQDGISHFELLFSGSPVPIFSHVFPCHKLANVLRIDIGMQPTTLGFHTAVKSISGVAQHSDQRRNILSLADIQLSPLTAALWCGVAQQRLN